MNEFATYDDVMDMMDDHDDTYDPEFRDPGGYCEHGNYVGGCGADLMCYWCERGISLAEARRIEAQRRKRERSEAAKRRTAMRMRIAELGYKPSEVLAPEFWKQV